MQNKNYAEKIQANHFNTIAAKYAAHYGDAWSQEYRRKFINDPMLENITLSGARVIDALCGSGETTGYLIEKGAQVTGVDISQAEIRHYQSRFPQCESRCASIFSTGLASNFYDCVVVVGGLHHLHPNVVDAIDEIHRILRVGGSFCFTEPHKGALPDLLRQLWYKSDRMFAENEAAIDLSTLKKSFSSKFKFIKEEYKGNIAYLLVLNSMIFRIPLFLKPLYSPFLIGIESILEKMQGYL